MSGYGTELLSSLNATSQHNPDKEERKAARYAMAHLLGLQAIAMGVENGLIELGKAQRQAQEVRRVDVLPWALVLLCVSLLAFILAIYKMRSGG